MGIKGITGETKPLLQKGELKRGFATLKKKSSPFPLVRGRG